MRGNPIETSDIPIPSVSGCPEEMYGIPEDALKPWCLIHGLTVLLVKKALPVSSTDAVNVLIDQVLS